MAALKRDMNAAARENGFAPSAFEPFWKIINQDNPGTFEIPERYFEMLGIAKSPTGFTQLSLLAAGKIITRLISLSGFLKAVWLKYSTPICSAKSWVIF